MKELKKGDTVRVIEDDFYTNHTNYRKGDTFTIMGTTETMVLTSGYWVHDTEVDKGNGINPDLLEKVK